MNKNNESLLDYAVSIIFGAIFFFLIKYHTCPAATFRSSDYFWIMAVTLFFISLIKSVMDFVDCNDRSIVLPIMPIITGIVFLFICICGLTGSKILNAKQYANRITITNGNWSDDMINIDSFDDSNIIDTIALMDSNTARTKSETALSSLSNVVSRYELGEFTQINIMVNL